MSEHSPHYVAILLLSLSIISVLAALVVVIFYFRYQRIRSHFLSTLIFLLSFLDILCWGNIIITSSYYLSKGHSITEYSPNFCAFMGFFWNFCEFLNFGVTLIISISLYLALMRNIDPFLHKNKMFVALLIISLILAIIPFCFAGDSDVAKYPLENISYGAVDDVKCWITHRGLRIYAFYTPLWIICFVNLIIITYFLRGLHLQFFAELHDQYQIRFVLFPAIMMGCYLIGSIRRIWELIEDCEDCTSYKLEIIMYATMPLQGVFNTLVFGLFEEFIRVRISAFFQCKCRLLLEMDRQELEMRNNEHLLEN